MFTDPAFLASAFAVLLGGVFSKFKEFIITPEEFRKQSSLSKKTRAERSALRLNNLQIHARNLQSGEVLRGDGRNNADLVGDYNDSVIEASCHSIKLDRLCALVDLSFSAIFYAMVVGIICSLAFLVWKDGRTYILIAALFLVSVELISVITIHKCKSLLHRYTDAN